MGEHAKGETLSVAFAGEDQHQDAGAKMVHAAPNTSSSIVSKSVAGRRAHFVPRAHQVNPGARVEVDRPLRRLLVDDISRSDTYRTTTSARTTYRWVTRPRSPRSVRTSCST